MVSASLSSAAVESLVLIESPGGAVPTIMLGYRSLEKIASRILHTIQIFCILALGSGQRLLYRLGSGLGLGPVFCSDCTLAVDCGPVTLCDSVPYAVTLRRLRGLL